MHGLIHVFATGRIKEGKSWPKLLKQFPERQQ
jgi:hypothetical protein